MTYIDNSPLFNNLPEKIGYSKRAKAWIWILAIGMAGTTVWATANYIKKAYLDNEDDKSNEHDREGLEPPSQLTVIN